MNGCERLSLRSALARFVNFGGATQSSASHQAAPLVRRLPARGRRWIRTRRNRAETAVSRAPEAGRPSLLHEPSLGGGGERTVYGGLKTKNVDVVVTKEGIGPVLAVSCKGAIGAFRNLTNRMEEAVGDCTNLHIAYPPLVCGYLFVMRANRAEEVGRAPAPAESGPNPPSRPLAENDVAIDADGRPVEAVRRFHAALRELVGRRGIRNDASRYEAISLALASTQPERSGDIFDDFPEPGSALRFERFFDALYRQYDERFVYAAPDLGKVTARREWNLDSPAFDAMRMADLCYDPRTVDE